MGSKKYKGKSCTYCVVPKSSTEGDHVVAREFFPLDRRDNLPQVPACPECNNKKSFLETYLTAVLPFGNTGARARDFLEQKVAPRIANNKRLARELGAGLQKEYVSYDGGHTWLVVMTLKFDSSKVIELFKFIAKGLAFQHWGVFLPDAEVVVYGDFLHSFGASAMESMLRSSATNRTGEVTLGDGVFKYEGVQDPKHAALTIWRMTLYGVVMDGGEKSPASRVTAGYVMTAPRDLKDATDVMRKFNPSVIIGAPSLTPSSDS